MLKLFGFTDTFIELISNYLSGGKATINLENGSFTNFFDINKGIGQGLSLSVLIFILSIEPLLLKINNSNTLSPIELQDWDVTDRSEAFADDLTVFTNDNLQEIKNLEQIINDFGMISSLTLNKAKTSI